MRMRRVCMAVLALSAALGASACSTARPVPSERQGLFDRISSADHSHRNNRLAKADGSSAARAIATSDAKNARAAMEVSAGQLHWPLQHVEITSPFGQRGGEFHEGIDLRARQGTPVYAAQEGTVIYAGSKIRGYGRLVVIRHFRQLSTIYAHNSRLLVRVGQFVRQGQKIAISGNTGHSKGPHLHFEVRDGLSALNPLEIMPNFRTADTQPLDEPKAQVVASAAAPGTAGKPAIAAPPTGNGKVKGVVAESTASDTVVSSAAAAEAEPLPIPPKKHRRHRHRHRTHRPVARHAQTQTDEG
jgi:hypothetical protein